MAAGLKLRVRGPIKYAISVKAAVAQDAEHQTGGLAVAVAPKADAAIQIKQQTIAKMGLQLFLTVPAPGPGKIGSIGSHGVPCLLMLYYTAGQGVRQAEI